MANFNINVLKEETPPYVNTPAIAFYNVFRGRYDTFEDSNDMLLRKINSEVLLRDIIERNNAIVLNQGEMEVQYQTNLYPILPATINDPNELSHVIFLLKDVVFESQLGKGSPSSIPTDLLQFETSPGNYTDVVLGTSLGNAIEYDISNLNKLYIKSYKADELYTEAFRGYIELYYNFRKVNTPFDEVYENWSVIRIQFGFDEYENDQTKPYVFNQINILRESDFNSVISNIGSYPIEMIKGTDINGNLIPIYYHGLDNVNDVSYFVEYNLTHAPGFSGNGVKFNSIEDNNGNHLLNSLNNIEPINIIEDFSSAEPDRLDIFNHVGAIYSPGTDNRIFTTNIIGIIEDQDYTTLI